MLRRLALLLIAFVAGSVVAGRRRTAPTPLPLPPDVPLPVDAAPAVAAAAAVAPAAGEPPRAAPTDPPAPRPRRSRRRRVLRAAAFATGAAVLIVGVIAALTAFYADSLVREFSAGAKAPVVAEAREVLGTDPIPRAATTAAGAATPATAPTGDDPGTTAGPATSADDAATTAAATPATTAAATPATTAAAAPTAPLKARPAEVFLLVGADRRLQGGEEYGRSDTMILLRLDHERDAISMLSIPRDLLVEIPGFGQQKINGAYSLGGPKLAIETIRDAFQVRIDHLLVIDFVGFARAVDALGGVYLPIDQRYYNQHDGSEATNYAEIDLHAGYQSLTGRQALDFVRYRHTDSTFVREQRQQLFLHELRRTLSDAGAARLLRTLRPAAESLTSDIDDARDVVRMLRDALAVPPEHVARITLQGTPQTSATTGASYIVAGPDEIAAAMQAFQHPELTKAPDRAARRRARTPANVTPGSTSLGIPRARPKPRRQDVPEPAEVEDDGYAASLLGGPAAEAGLRICTPTLRPAGAFTSGSEPARAYRLAGEPAVAYSTEVSMGENLLWMWTTWSDPPILRSPTREVRVGRRVYRVYEEAGKARMVAWQSGDVTAWLTNTISSTQPLDVLLKLADGCRL